jgi:hypothetical protein
MRNWQKIIIVILIMILILIAIWIISNQDHSTSNNIEILANNELGNVSVERNYGNSKSPIKIAIIVGVHPLEFNSHNAIIKQIKLKNKSLSYSYDVYIINVTKDRNDFDKGRMNGQILAKNFVTPLITSRNYTFAVDIHSHRGVYVANNFLVAPLNNKRSKTIATSIANDIDGLDILDFVPANDGSPTSPDYVTIPIINNGTPAIIYETYLNESNTVVNKLMSLFIEKLDNYQFS